jgi:hypothetical protein
MKSKYAVNWTQVIEAFRSAGALMVMQGLVFGFLAEAPQLVSWAKGSVLVGMLFWAAASLARHQDF